jgi:predicted small secreted protein
MRIALAVLSLALASCASSRRVGQDQARACWLTESAPRSGVLVCASAEVVAAAVSACNTSVELGQATFNSCMGAKNLHSPIIVHAPVLIATRRTCQDLYPAELCPSTGQ